jgi:hypothetical protein
LALVWQASFQYANREFGMKSTRAMISMRSHARLTRDEGGFTLAEAVIAAAIATIGLAGAMLLNAQQLKLVRSAIQSNAATIALQDRLEQIRLAGWVNLTDTTRLEQTVFNRTPDSANLLPEYTERITLSPWPESTVKKLEVLSKGGGGLQVISDGSELAGESQGRVDVVVTWRGADNRVRERSSATIVSDGGFTRIGLRALENRPSPSGRETEASAPAQQSEPPPAASSTPQSTPPASSSTSQDYGVGRGNTGGKPGKG